MNKQTFVGWGEPELAILAVEEVAGGWRGLTSEGEVLNVRGGARPPKQAMMVNGNSIVAQYEMGTGTDVAGYLAHFERSSALHFAQQFDAALREIDVAISIAPTTRARMNRALLLLSLGRWEEGLSQLVECESKPPFQRPFSTAALAAGMRLWEGEDIGDKRLLLLHDHGFGDTIQMLRYVPFLRDKRHGGMGMNIAMVMPEELRVLASQFGQVTTEFVDADYFCPMLHLLHALRVRPDSMIPMPPYIAPSADLRRKWRALLPGRKRIGLAWSVKHPVPGDYPRDIPLAQMIAQISPGEAALFSLQQQGEAEADANGVRHFGFADFADLAAFMACMDAVISVDTAALHLAGAIGHDDVIGLLSDWHSWRWQAPWYQIRWQSCPRIQ